MKGMFSVGLIAGAVALSATSADAALVAVWDFNTQTTNVFTNGFQTDVAPDGGDQVATANVRFQSTAATAGTAGTNFGFVSGGTTINAVGATPAGNHVDLRRGERWDNGTVTFTFDGTGLSDAELSFAALRAGNNSVSSFQASYSTDGINFTDFGGIVALPTAWTLVTVDPGSALDGVTTAAIRLTFSNDGVSTNTGDAVRFDNIQINAVPEPASMALLALGGLVLVSRRRD